jgi:hypothetical protein
MAKQGRYPPGAEGGHHVSISTPGSKIHLYRHVGHSRHAIVGGRMSPRSQSR